MVKQSKAGVTDRDLPWWFDLYHIAWMLFFPVMWYFFGLVIATSVFFVLCIAFVTLA
jgi:hypothetical protein